MEERIDALLDRLAAYKRIGQPRDDEDFEDRLDFEAHNYQLVRMAEAAEPPPQNALALRLAWTQFETMLQITPRSHWIYGEPRPKARSRSRDAATVPPPIVVEKTAPPPEPLRADLDKADILDQDDRVQGRYQVDPVRADLLQVDQVQADPVQADPVQADPVQADPVQADPVQVGPVQVGPVQVGPVQVGPVQVDPLQAIPVPVVVPALSPLAAGMVRKKMSENLADFLAYRAKQDGDGRAESNVAPIIRFAIDLLGDVDLTEFNGDHLLLLKMEMTDIPTNAGFTIEERSSLYKKYKIAQDCGFEREQGGKTLQLFRVSKGTLNGRYKSGLRAYFLWAITHKRAHGPVPDFTYVTKKNPGKGRRDSFSSSEIVKLVAMPLFTGCESLHRVWKAGDFFLQSFFYWCILISVLCGMRPGEISQLRCRDILDLHGQPHFRFARFSDSSDEDDGDGDRSGAATKAWGHLKETYGFDRKGLTLYSARHTFKGLIDDLTGLAERSRQILCGWSTENTVPNQYGPKKISEHQMVIALNLDAPMIQEMEKILVAAKVKAGFSELKTIDAWRIDRRTDDARFQAALVERSRQFY